MININFRTKRCSHTNEIYFLNGLIFSQCSFWELEEIINSYHKRYVSDEYPNYEQIIRDSHANSHTTGDQIEKLLSKKFPNLSEWDYESYFTILVRLGIGVEKILNYSYDFRCHSTVFEELIEQGIYDDVLVKETSPYLKRKTLKKFKCYENFLTADISGVRYECVINGFCPTEMLKDESLKVKLAMIDKGYYTDKLSVDKNVLVRGYYHQKNPNMACNDSSWIVKYMYYLGRMSDGITGDLINEIASNENKYISDLGNFLMKVNDSGFNDILCMSICEYLSKYNTGHGRDYERVIDYYFDEAKSEYYKFIKINKMNLYESYLLRNHHEAEVIYTQPSGRKYPMTIKKVEFKQPFFHELGIRSNRVGDIRLDYTDTPRGELGFWVSPEHVNRIQLKDSLC